MRSASFRRLPEGRFGFAVHGLPLAVRGSKQFYGYWLVLVNGLRSEVRRLTVCCFDYPEIVRPRRTIPASRSGNWPGADWVG